MAVAVDSYSGGYGFVIGASTITYSFTNTAGNALSFLGVVYNFFNTPTQSPTVSYGGQLLTVSQTSFDDGSGPSTMLTGYLLTPPTGANNIVFYNNEPTGNPVYMGCRVVSVSGVNTSSTPTMARGLTTYTADDTNQAFSTSISSNTNSLVIGFGAYIPDVAFSAELVSMTGTSIQQGATQYIWASSYPGATTVSPSVTGFLDSASYTYVTLGIGAISFESSSTPTPTPTPDTSSVNSKRGTHLGPWLLGTNKITGPTVFGTMAYRNMGATIVGQTCNVDASASLTGTLGYLPAGSIVTAVYLYTTSAFNGTPSVVVAVNGTTVTVNPTFSSGLFSGKLGFAQTSGAAGVLANIGTTDKAVTYTVSGSGTSSGTAAILIQYIVRNFDGTYQPTYTQI